MITTIQLNDNVKQELDRLKIGRETYEDVILKLMKALQQQRRKQEELLIEGYKELAEENMKIQKEFDSIEDDFDWQW